MSHRVFVHSYLIIWKKKKKTIFPKRWGSVYKFYDRRIRFDRLWKCRPGVRGGRPEGNYARGSKWKIRANSLKTTENILWFLLVLFSFFFLFCFGLKIAAHVTAFFPRHFYDATIYRLIFPRTIWRFLCRKRIVHWDPHPCVCGQNYLFDEFPFFIFTPKNLKRTTIKGKVGKGICVKRLYGYIFFQNDRSNKYFASHSENVQYVLPTEICFWNTKFVNTIDIELLSANTREVYTTRNNFFFTLYMHTIVFLRIWFKTIFYGWSLKSKRVFVSKYFWHVLQFIFYNVNELRVIQSTYLYLFFTLRGGKKTLNFNWNVNSI